MSQPVSRSRAAWLALLLLAPLARAQGESPTVDELVRAHLDARGGADALRAIQTLVYRDGHYREGDLSSTSAYMAYKRPYLRVVGNPAQPGGFLEGYDGSSWEWYADPGVVLRTVGAASGATRRASVIGGYLLDHRARGTTLELRSPEEVDGRPAHRLTVTLRDGFAIDLLLDRETHLVVAQRMSAPVHAFGAEVATESRFLDHRPVAGVLFAHTDRTVERATGRVLSSMTWGTIEAGVELPDAWFSPPEFPRTRLQTFLERLYLARDDPHSVMWSYADLRHFHPELPTRPGVEFIGYQMLKMGATASAIELLAANVRDHPHSASAEFALGRAHATAGHVDDAAWHYERALLLDPDHAEAARGLEEPE